MKREHIQSLERKHVDPERNGLGQVTVTATVTQNSILFMTGYTGQIRIIRNGSLQRVWFELSGIYELKYMFLFKICPKI